MATGNGHGTQQAYHDYLMSQLSDLYYTAAARHDICAIRAKMQEIVPEIQSPGQPVCPFRRIAGSDPVNMLFLYVNISIDMGEEGA